MEISQGVEPWVVTYNNVSRGERQMEGSDDAVPSIIESQGMKRSSVGTGSGSALQAKESLGGFVIAGNHRPLTL